jgi:hypothetical protein
MDPVEQRLLTNFYRVLLGLLFVLGALAILAIALVFGTCKLMC